MPAVLVELGYLSHPSEEKVLKDPEFMSDFTEAIGQGIREFFGQGEQN
jgi:N-acetylmuramoyl-L-alanine amidase